MAFGISAGAAALIGGGLSAAGSIIGGSMASDASQNAADTQAASADRAAQLQNEQFNKQVELQAPFREAGLTAQNKLLDYMGLSAGAGGKYAKDFSMADYQADPGYAFRLSEGMKGLNATAAARGGLISGNALRAATQYGQDMGSQEYQNAFNRYQTNRSNQLNPLQSLMGSSQTATNAMGQAGQNYADQAGEAYMGAGNARASGYVGSANAWNQALGGASNALTQGIYANNIFGNNSNTLSGLQNTISNENLYNPSDRRLKTNIVKIGQYMNGLNKYSWTYLWGENATGAMADEVEKVIPEAVKVFFGFKHVNYALLGV